MGNTKQTGKSCVDGSLLSMRRELIYGQVTFLALAFAKAAFLALDFVRPAFQVPPFAEAVYSCIHLPDNFLWVPMLWINLFVFVAALL